MRTLPSDLLALLDVSAGYSTHAHFEVKDSTGVWRELTDLAGYDWFVSARWNDDIDQPVAAATIRLVRDHTPYLSLSPLRSDSKLNLLTGSYSPLINPGREVRLWTAITPMGAPTPAWQTALSADVSDGESDLTVASTVDFRTTGTVLIDPYGDWETQSYTVDGPSDFNLGSSVTVFSHSAGTIVRSDDAWTLSFHGYIEEVELADGEIELECHDLGARVAQCFIETERTYSNDTGTAVQTVMQSVLDDNLGASVVTLATPTSPSWNVKTFKQKKQPTLDALRDLALQIGWDVRYKWKATAGDYGIGDFALTFYQPDRSRSTIDFVADPTQYLSIKKLHITRADIRNRVQVVYSDRASLDVSGVWTRTITVAEDSTSIGTYGKQFMELAEAGSSMIDTSTEANKMRDAALADLKDPKADQEIELLFTPHLEVGDLIRCKANGVHYNTDQDLAIVSVTHELSLEKQRTTAQVRGKPCGPRAIWIEYEARPGSAKTAPNVAPDAPTGLTVTQVQGGAAVTFTPPASGQWDSFEIHKSTSTGFTPSSGTLAATTYSTRAELGDLAPGTTYYFKVVARRANVRSSASSQASNSAGYTPPRAMDPQTVYERLPFNPDFESWTLGSGAPPDSWFVRNGGVWGTVADRTTSDAQSGAYAVHLKITGAFDTHPDLYSEAFPVIPGEAYQLAFYAKRPASNGGGSAQLVWVSDITGNSGFGTTTGSPIGGAIAGSTTYVYNTFTGVAPAGAKYARVELTSSTNQESYFDNVTVRSLGPDWIAPTFGTNWGNGSVGYGLTATVDRSGYVRFRGTAKRSSGTATTAATFTAGLRPGATEYFGVWDKTGAVQVEASIDTSGNVVIAGAVNSHDYSFSGVSYLALN